MEIVANFKDLELLLDQTDDDWLAVWWNSKRVRRVWGRLVGLYSGKGRTPKWRKCSTGRWYRQ